MANCSSCFYGQAKEYNGQMNVMVRLCRRHAPTRAANSVPGLSTNWPIVQDDDWCGEGANSQTGVSYGPAGAVVNG